MILGNSLDRLRAFRSGHAATPGFNSTSVQRGLDPDDWKPMLSVGSGAREIRMRDATGIYRVIYLARFAEAVYVLHAFQKKTQRTSPRDLALAQSRSRDLKQRGWR